MMMMMPEQIQISYYWKDNHNKIKVPDPVVKDPNQQQSVEQIILKSKPYFTVREIYFQ